MNLLIKRYTLEIENVAADLNKKIDQNEDQLLNPNDEWNYRDSLLKCLYSKDNQYPISIILKLFLSWCLIAFF